MTKTLPVTGSLSDPLKTLRSAKREFIPPQQPFYSINFIAWAIKKDEMERQLGRLIPKSGF